MVVFLSWRMSHPVAGELFAQRFPVEARIAAGDMSAIFRAIDQRTGRPVALKLLQSHGSAEAIHRFARETQIPPRAAALGR
jgi:hypothetical protein